MRKTPVMLGGEHSITLGGVQDHAGRPSGELWCCTWMPMPT